MEVETFKEDSSIETPSRFGSTLKIVFNTEQELHSFLAAINVSPSQLHEIFDKRMGHFPKKNADVCFDILNKIFNCYRDFYK